MDARLYAIISLFALFLPSSIAKTCPGTSSGSSLQEDPLQYSMKRFSNCTIIDGNLEITGLNQHQLDLSFLSSIEEVTGYVLFFHTFLTHLWLPNLRLVRGDRTVECQKRRDKLTDEISWKNCSIKLEDNPFLTELGLVSLVEITHGDVAISGSDKLCYKDTVNWTDLFVSEDSSVAFDESPSAVKGCKCSEACPEYSSGRHCWGGGEDQCQNLTKMNCKEDCGDRCFGTDWNQCCSPNCAGGCSGRSSKECFRCRRFNNDGACEAECPPPTIYNVVTYLKEPNPHVKYAYGHSCLVKCPENMYADGGACVQRCPEGQRGLNGSCTPCDGPCPKTCKSNGKSLSNLNIETFEGCTIIEDDLRITSTAFSIEYDHRPLTPDDLRLLENVTIIEGSLTINANSTDFKSLHFLKNLRTINGKDTGNKKNGLRIYKTSLEELGLDSLHEVKDGKVVIAENDKLCYADGLNWTSIMKSKTEIVVGKNRNVTECESEGRVCADACDARGCFGPSDTQCLGCRSHKQGERCTFSCHSGWFLPESSTSSGVVVCQRCHDECRGSCSGTEPDQCDQCLHFKDGPYCVSSCPPSKYPDSEGKCESCSAGCNGGCSGPEDKPGNGGCNDCHLMLMDVTGTIGVRCLPPEPFCPTGYYPYKNKECRMCHSECSVCYGSSAADCDLQTCKSAVQNDKCVSDCFSDQFADNSTKPANCQQCDKNCLKCYGPTSAHCHSCRGLKVYVNYENRKNDPRFNCTSSCPASTPFKINEDDGDSSTVCVSDKYSSGQSSAPKSSNAGLIAGLIVGALLLLALIIALIFFLRRQRAHWELEKTKMEAKMGGYDDETEPLAVTGAAPDKAQLRIIRESELRMEGVIGSGAFGTVHKGAWVPEGENVRIPVAIKILSEGTNATQNKELLDEARIMASVDHPNCVRITAICMTNPIQLIQPLMPFGSLLDYIRKNKHCIGSRALLKWTTQIAKGMKYLEDRGIVHRDLAARNVLVKNANHVRITDFGLSKLLDVDQSQIEANDGKMPIKWMAIESIRHRIYTHKSDVWSYGVTIWELFTYGQRPYEYLSAVDVLETLEKGERLSQPDICTIDIYMIMIKCWMVDAQSRPNFQELVDEFTKMSRDPGRYVVIQGDQFMKLPVQIIDSKDLIKDDGPEEIMSADDYYLQPVESTKSDNRHLQGDAAGPKQPRNYGDKTFSDLKKKVESEQQQMEGNKYTTDPTEKTHGAVALDFEVDPTSDYDPFAVLVVDDKSEQHKGSTSSLSGAGRGKLSKDKKQKSDTGSSEYLKMSRSSPKEDKKAMLAEFEDDTIDDEDDYLLSTQPVSSNSRNNYYNVADKTKSNYYNVASGKRKNSNVSNV